ncbi:MAG: response regulator transcription factor [Devosia sp.]|uniref:LuxR C-terminal-related transcriptional regulator n=1 Tax=Devosia sp. TaxID=1871048 RepID=UPI001ACFD628|nr:response regulator transcription factor [Devosia sp.]MBN9315713.1 response regulator transcription factor [Devosia sp.]
MASEPDGAADLSGRIRVALVDDHPTLLMGVSALFASDPRFTIVGTGLSATAAIDLVEAHEPDVVTLDLSMPGDVFTAIRSIVDTSPGTRVLIFTAYADVDLALRALDAGAHGFVLKGRPAEELFDAIDTVSKGALYISPDFSPKLLSGLRNRSRREKATVKLSPREQQLLDCLLEGMSNKEIARKLELTEKTVKHYMTNLMNKLKVKSRLEVVLAAPRLRAPTSGETYRPADGDT